MKWVVTLFWLALGFAVLWYFGILQAVGNAFNTWLRWIGAR